MTGSKSFDDDKLIINYNNEACVYGRDLKLLQSPTGWLNDSCINYFLRRLAVLHQNDTKNNHQSPLKDILMDPSVLSWFMHQCEDEDEIQEFNTSQNSWEKAGRVFMPINDNMGQHYWTQPGMGTHWSLLLLVLDHGNKVAKGWHYDSLEGEPNRNAAIAVAKKWWSAFQCSEYGRNWTFGQIKTASTPKQTNGYDCGLYVLAYINAIYMFPNDAQDHLCNALLHDGCYEIFGALDTDIRKFRIRIIDDILEQANIQKDV